MTQIVLEAGFHSRAAALRFPVREDDYRELFGNLTKLALGERGIANFYLLRLSDTQAAVISVKDIQYLYCLEHGAKATVPSTPGVRLYLHGRPDALDIDLDPEGPIHDLILEMLETHYGEDPEGCVVTPDTAGNPLFFRPDDLDCLFLDDKYLQGYQPKS